MNDVYVCEGDGCASHPQVCVGWCDAFAYCEASGKRLCGKIGDGEVGWGDYADATQGQWYDACSSHGAHAFPYGDVYEPQTYAGPDNDVSGCVAACTMAPVGSLPHCQSTAPGFAGIYDISGNAWKWVASCEASSGATDNCRSRGGSFGNGVISKTQLQRDDVGRSHRRDTTYNSIGFRCCSH